MKTLILPLITILAGCVNTKKFNEVILQQGIQYHELRHIQSISEGTDLDDPPDTIQYTVKTVTTKNQASLRTSDHQINVTPTSGSAASNSRKLVQGKDVSDATFNALIKLEARNQYPSPLVYFSSPVPKDVEVIDELKQMGEQPIRLKSDPGIHMIDPFRYIEIKPVFQAMTVPFKYRKQLNDTIAAQVTSGFNVGFAYGQKFTWKQFTQFYRVGELLSSRDRSFSLTPGVFIGPTLVGLENGKSVNEPIDLDRTVAGITTGGFVVIGINQLNLGLACGIDKALGDDGNKWIYQNDSFWWGFVLALDFIK